MVEPTDERRGPIPLGYRRVAPRTRSWWAVAMGVVGGVSFLMTGILVGAVGLLAASYSGVGCAVIALPVAAALWAIAGICFREALWPADDRE